MPGMVFQNIHSHKGGNPNLHDKLMVEQADTPLWGYSWVLTSIFGAGRAQEIAPGKKIPRKGYNPLCNTCYFSIVVI